METDTILKQVREFCLKGWPNGVKNIDLKPYFLRRNEISVERNILLWGHRVIVPKILRKKILNLIHTTHQGIVKSKSLARSYVWWPSLNNEIEEHGRTCEACGSHRANPPRVPLTPWPVENSPWNRIHLDFLGPIQNQVILIITDSFSKWIEAFPMINMTSHAVIVKLREVFARFGLPRSIVSDNQTCFASEEFRYFLQRNGIKQMFSPPFNPASNGAAENTVKNLKHFLIKEITENKKIDLARCICRYLLVYRNTPHCSTKTSPAKCMFNRSLRMRLDLIKPTNNNADGNCIRIKENIVLAQNSQKFYFRGGRKASFFVGQRVRVKDYRQRKPTWTLGEIVETVSRNLVKVKIYDSDAIWIRHINQVILFKPELDFEEQTKVCVPISQSADIIDLTNEDEAHNEGTVERVVSNEEVIGRRRSLSVGASASVRPRRNRVPPERFHF